MYIIYINIYIKIRIYIYVYVLLYNCSYGNIPTSINRHYTCILNVDVESI